MLSPVALLVIAGALGGVQSITSSTTACETERAACLADAACNACLSGPEPTDFCSQRYPSIFTDGSAGEGAGFDFCEATGATNCCEFETKEVSNECLTNSASIAFWSCVMEDEGCVVNDMPCFVAESSTTEPATTTPPITTEPATTTSPITPAPSSSDLATPTSPAAPTSETPETVDFAKANRTVGFPKPIALVGLVVASLVFL